MGGRWGGRGERVGGGGGCVGGGWGGGVGVCLRVNVPCSRAGMMWQSTRDLMLFSVPMARLPSTTAHSVRSSELDEPCWSRYSNLDTRRAREAERERQREGERERGREREEERGIERERQRARQREGGREREAERARKRESEAAKESQRAGVGGRSAD